MSLFLFFIVVVAHCPLFISGYRSIQVPLFCAGMSTDMFICAMYYCKSIQLYYYYYKSGRTLVDMVVQIFDAFVQASVICGATL